jgi:hypothetical protein
MPRFRALARISAHLLAAGPSHVVQPGRRHRFRLLVIGPAVLVQPEPGPWWVTVAGGRGLRPVAAGLRAGAVGLQSAVRVAAALLDPLDLATGGPELLTALHPPRPAAAGTEFYGWSLLYRLPGDDAARVDPDDHFPELPAFYESPLELADRQEFLGRRGVPTRVLALLTSRTDFDISPGRSPRNRYFDHADWRRAGAAAALVG